MSVSDAVDLHERAKNFLAEAEVECFLQAAKSGRHGIRDHLRGPIKMIERPNNILFLKDSSSFC
jgi:hypothetical protein